MVDFRSLGASAAGPVFPTCHAFAPSCADGFDLAVGLSTGEGGHALLGCPTFATFAAALGALAFGRVCSAEGFLQACRKPLSPARAPGARCRGLPAFAALDALRAHLRPGCHPPVPAVVLLSLRAQLKALASNTRPASSLCLNVDGCTNASRCVALAWLPGSEGTAFVAAHRDGAVLLYHKARGRR